MRRRWPGMLAAVIAPIVVLAAAPVSANADSGGLVHPGMEIRMDTTVCTLGYVDAQTRIAFTAGHCQGSGPVIDRYGNHIGDLSMFRANTPDGTTIGANHLISDWATIGINAGVGVNNILPGGRALVSDPNVVAQPGQRVCHFGVVTGESCGTVEAVNNGWFTMANGVVGQKGDSGGPVYVLTPDGRAVIIGMFNSTWGQFPAAVSWNATRQQAGLTQV